MRGGRADAGIEVPRSRFWSRLVYCLALGSVLALFGTGFAISTILPDGVPWEGPRIHKGMLFVPDEGAAMATWASEETLRSDEEGWTFGQTACVDVPPLVQQALGSVGRNRHGGKSIWVEAVAETRIAAVPCLQSPSRRGRRQIGTAIRIRRVLAVKPLGCDGDAFIAHGLKCPVRRKVEPVRVDDTSGDFYPASARRAGAEGATRVRVLIAAPRNVLGCTVIRSSGNKDLDEATCALLRRRPDHVAKRGRTDGFAAGVRQVEQEIQWKLDQPK